MIECIEADARVVVDEEVCFIASGGPVIGGRADRYREVAPPFVNAAAACEAY